MKITYTILLFAVLVISCKKDAIVEKRTINDSIVPDNLKINQIQVLGSHNSYRLNADEDIYETLLSLQHLLPDNLDLSIVDQVEQVSNEEAIEWAHKLMQQEGIIAGISSGAAMAIADRVSKQPDHKGKTIVVILPDSAERYLSTPLFEGTFSENETVQ